jgi:hypothetical protein
MPNNPSLGPVRVAAARSCAHDRANRFIFSWWPPVGRHLETGVTEDHKLSQICVWTHFKLVECCDRLVYIDDDERVAIVEQRYGSVLDTPVRIARNGGAG